MYEGPKLLLIDGMNLAFREHYSKKNLSYRGRSVDVIFGVFKSLISFQKKWPEHQMIIAWEGGYTRRLEESKRGVELGLCPETYKENRRRRAEEQPDDELESLFEQLDQLQADGLPKTRVMQVRIKGFEADDVLNTYADFASRNDGHAVIVSSDQDFYQCIRENVDVYDPRKRETWNLERFHLEFGYDPDLWVDKGAIEGEVGPTKDNIFGIDGWGPKTANDYVIKYGDCDNIFSAISEKEKRGKKEETFLSQFDRLMLAKSLKRMDVIEKFPMPRFIMKPEEKELKKFFLEFGFMSIAKDAWRLV
jgi:DNA polymerase-1